jgi:hypothetical protein
MSRLGLSSKEMIAVRILAFSMFRELKKQGYDLRHIVALAGELIGLACEAIRADRTPRDVSSDAA